MITAEVGQVLPAVEVCVTRDRVVRYAGASTDFNPIHWNDRSAQALGLPGVIVHGMWTMGAALRVVTEWVGDPARVVNYFVRFTSPIAVPDDDQGTTLSVSATVTDVTDGIATIAIEAAHGEDKVLGAAKAQVRLS